MKVYPTLGEVLFLIDDRAVTVDQAISLLGLGWEKRGTIRNRLEELVDMELAIRDDDAYPMRYTRSQFRPGGGER